MNPAAILTLISGLVEQIASAEQRIQELEAQVEQADVKQNGKPAAQSVGKEG